MKAKQIIKKKIIIGQLKFPQTKVKTILAFDPLVKLHFMPKDTIHSFSHRMLQPFTTTTIVFYVIGVCGEIDNKFELLIVDKIVQKTFKL
jgi:hypothetical protein